MYEILRHSDGAKRLKNLKKDDKNGTSPVSSWQSLGLLYREQKDIDAGVEIVVVKTLGISSNTYYGTMIFNGQFVTAEDMGNITFGYLGRAAGFFDEMLKTGSFSYHILDKNIDAFEDENLANENADHDMIIYGAKLYDEMH